MFRGRAQVPVVPGNYDVPLVSREKVCVACGKQTDLERVRVEGYLLTVCVLPIPCLSRAGIVRGPIR